MEWSDKWRGDGGNIYLWYQIFAEKSFELDPASHGKQIRMPIIKLFNHLIFLLIKFQTKNYEMKMTGVGRQKPLSIFDQLCLGFVREAKGNTAVDYISSVPEPSGSDQVSLPVNRKANMNEVTAPPLLPEPECPKKKKKIERETGESSSTWKKDFLTM